MKLHLGPSCTSVVQIWVEDKASQVPEPLSLNDRAVNFVLAGAWAEGGMADNSI